MTTSETTETKRDLHADLAVCSAATEGPWYVTEDDERPIVSDHYAILLARGSDVAYVGLSSEDQEFIVEARTAWPHAIERAINAERWLLALVEALERGDIAQTRLSSGMDYIIYHAREAVGR